MSAPKVLVVGSILGQLEKAFQKISKIQAKQNFTIALVVGDLFSQEQSLQSEKELALLMNGSIPIALPTYFTLGDHSLPPAIENKLEEAADICPNLFYLGRKGTFKTAEGIRIVNLGGRLVQNEASLTQGIGKYDSLYLDSDAKSLAGAHSADILITNQWPTGITRNSSIPGPDSIDMSNSTQAIADLNLSLKPRYHFASSPSAAWSREPFIHAIDMQRQIKSYEDLDGPAVKVTRFTSLASVDKGNKEWISAFTLDPTKPPSSDGAQPSCPLESSTSKRKRPEDGTTNGYSRYDNDSSRGHRDRREKRSRRDPISDRFDKGTCFMCAGTPVFRPEMLVSIGEESMLTVLKGPLPVRYSTFPTIHSSGHIMIIPMYHALDEAAHGKRSLEDLRTEFAEMSKYKTSLQNCFGRKGLGSVCWEVNRTGIRHLHWQLIAAPRDKIESGLVEAAYKVAGEKAQYPPFQACEPDRLITDRSSDYFRVWISHPTDAAGRDYTTVAESTLRSKLDREARRREWAKLSPAEKAERLANGETEPGVGDEEVDNDDNGTSPTPPPPPPLPSDVDGSRRTEETSMYFAIPPSMRFNIGFGREVMAGLLQLEDRSNWRNCESSVEIEAADAQAFKEDYGKWDWAMAS